MQPITSKDQELIAIAKETIVQHLVNKRHNLAAVMSTKDGQIIKGINVAGSFGCVDICAEAIALGKALLDGFTDIEVVVTVRHPKPTEADQNIKVVNPCGKCRELLVDYIPDAWVVIRGENNQLLKQKARDLIPYRYQKT